MIHGIRARSAVAIAVALVASLVLTTVSSPLGAEGEVTLTYDFDADAVGERPAGVEAVSGDVAAVDDLLLGRSMRATRADATTGLAVADLRRVLATDMTVTWRESSLPLTGSRHGFVLRSNGGLSGYLFQINTLTTDASRNTVNLYRLTDGAPPTLMRSVGYLAKADRWFRASTWGNVITLATSDDGVTYRQLFSLTDGLDPYVSGGLLFTAGWNRTDPSATTVDNVKVTHVPVAGVINIVTPASYQVRQRAANGTADLDVSGTYRGEPTTIEARWGTGDWTVLDPAPSGGAFSGRLTALPTGQRTLELRFGNEPTVVAKRAGVSVGDVFVIAGQSNAVGKGRYLQTAAPHDTIRPSMLGNDDRWKVLADPVDSPANQVDSVSRDVAGGSVWPIVAGKALADTGVPVAFVPTARSGTSISEWQRNDAAPEDRSTLYGNMASRIRAVGGARAVLLWQGETDAYTGMPGAAYEAGLQAFADDVFADFGVPVVAAQIGDVTRVPGARIDAIRLAQQRLWNAGGHILAGPALYDVELEDDGGDGVHFYTNGDIALAADRWWQAIRSTIYGTGDGRGASLTSAVANAARNEITVSFSDESLPLDPAVSGGFTVKVSGLSLPITEVVRTSPSSYVIRLAAPASIGTLTVSLAEGRTGTGKPVPLDSSISNHPAEVFVDTLVA